MNCTKPNKVVARLPKIKKKKKKKKKKIIKKPK